MRHMLSTVDMDGIVVIGEGEKDEAPMLFNGESRRQRAAPQGRRRRRPGRRHPPHRPRPAGRARRHRPRRAGVDVRPGQAGLHGQDRRRRGSRRRRSTSRRRSPTTSQQVAKAKEQDRLRRDGDHPRPPPQRGLHAPGPRGRRPDRADRRRRHLGSDRRPRKRDSGDRHPVRYRRVTRGRHRRVRHGGAAGRDPVQAVAARRQRSGSSPGTRASTSTR